MNRSVVLALAALQVAAIIPPRPIERVPPMPLPPVSAQAWILYDETNDLILSADDADVPRPMASTTKIMTGLLAIESGRLDELVTVSERAAEVGESEIGLVAGEMLPLEMLVHAVLIRSANDAAVAIAEHVGGSVEGFSALMNARAAELGLEHTAFANPHGLDDEAHFSTARDLLTLAQAAIADPEFAEIVTLTRYRIEDAPDGTERVAEATNTLLESYRGTFGVKTGFTFRAGLVFVGGAERDGRRIWVVVMGSDGPGAHFADAAALLDYAFEDLRVIDTITKGTPFRLVSNGVTEDLTALARLHTLLFVNSLEPLALPEPAAPESDPAVVLTADLPGPADALLWLFGGSPGG